MEIICGHFASQKFQLSTKPIMASISVKAGKTLQNPNIHQNQEHGQVSKMKKAKLIDAEQWAIIAERYQSRIQ